MRKNVLFLIHGIGNHDKGWSDAAQKVLKDEFSRYMKHSNKNVQLADQLSFVEISYNDIFVSIWKRWSQLIEKVQIPGNAEQVFSSLIDQLGEPTAAGSQVGNNRKIDYAGDVVLYYSLDLVQRLVQLRVMSEITRHMVKHLEKDHLTEFGVLGHSMGTAVAHDALHKLGSVRWTSETWKDNVESSLLEADALLRNTSGNLSKSDKKLLNKIKSRAAFPGPLAESFKFSIIMMVANTSRILSRTVDPYKSIVRPYQNPFESDVLGFTDYYVNVSHKLDPICHIKKFDTEKINQPLGFAIDVNVSHLYDENVHSLEHYLINPAAHRDLFDTMCPDSFEQAERNYANSRLDTHLQATGNEDFFARRGGNFSDEVIQAKMRESLVKNLNDVLEELV